MPALVRGGVDNGILAEEFCPIIVVSLIGLAIVCADWVINVIQTNVVGRNGERLLYTLRVKIFAHLQRLGLDFYEHELSGRIMTRMTTDVDALSTFLQTGLITLVNSVLLVAGVLAALLIINLELGLTCWRSCRWPRWPRRCSAARPQCLPDARDKVSTSTPTSRRTWPGCASRRPTAARDATWSISLGAATAYRRSRLRAQRYIALYFPFVQSLSILASALVCWSRRARCATAR